MQSMIKGLLDFAQVGGEDVEFEAVELDELFDDMRLDLRSRIKRSGAEVTLAPGLPTVTSWRMGLERVFANLLDNALKYGGEPPRIEVESRRRDGWTEVLVRDHGGGVDPADRERILKDYGRLNPVAEGLGLGLSIVKRILTRVGGELRLETPAEGSGACFVVRLPETPVLRG
ncbi:MAG: HAMP domain-containing sensor histidine kinase [Planctomycetota bacterium]